MQNRRQFIHRSTLAGIALAAPDRFSFLHNIENIFSYESSYLKLKLWKDRPEFYFFSTDSLGNGQFPTNTLFKTEKDLGKSYRCESKANGITWLLNQATVWGCKMSSKSIQFDTCWKEGADSPPFVITFSQRANHCTVLGTIIEENRIRFPCILHFPGMGTFKIYCNDPDVSLYYDSELTDEPYIKIALSGANQVHPNISYTFVSDVIYPKIEHIENDTRYDGFKKNFINIFQINPRRKILSNNSTSDACAFTLFLYAEMAKKTPPLVDGLSAFDLIRNTLDEYFTGVLAYGMVGKSNWQSEYDSSDSYPSLIIAACYYILGEKDWQWAEKHYNDLKAWADKMIATDTNRDGIIEYGYSGNSGSWDTGKFKRPANWWDTIGFGHDDAYSNALAYKACVLLSKVAEQLNKIEDGRYFDNFSISLKKSYYPKFYDPETGVLGGWRSSDGVLHNYYFTFVNSIAVCYDLIDKQKGKKIMQAMLNKMKEIGYTDFHLGLPGNLIPVADKDYVARDPRWGFQRFQVYENGGATGCYVYYTINALFKLGMRKEAEEILFPMLESYKEGNFNGNCQGSTMTRDWKTWSGECWGYEGFLVDNYLALLNVSDYFESLR